MDMICAAIKRKIPSQLHRRPYLIAIDGRCASGKTSLAEQLRQELGCHVIHMDDFFLQPGQRTKERLLKPGENIEWE